MAAMSATGRIDATDIGTPVVAGSIGRPAVEVDVANVPIRDHVRWGPVLAGVVTGMAAMLFLTIIGIALGLTALGSDDPGTWGTAAGIWGGLSLLVSFFLGGWMAARAAATEFDASGALNGFVTGAATLLLLVWLATSALTGALGFFAGTIADIAGAAAPVAMQAVEEGAVPAAPEAETTVTEAVENPEAAVPEQVDEAAAAAAETARESAGPGAWGTAIAIILAIGAATLGGVVGQNSQMMIPGSRSVVSRT
jgi:signal transduction histidine kinase